MIALEHHRPLCRLLARHPRRRRPLHFDILLNDGAIQFDFEKLRIGHLLAVFVEFRRLDIDDVLLPRYRRQGKQTPIRVQEAGCEDKGKPASVSGDLWYLPASTLPPGA